MSTTQLNTTPNNQSGTSKYNQDNKARAEARIEQFDEQFELQDSLIQDDTQQVFSLLEQQADEIDKLQQRVQNLQALNEELEAFAHTMAHDLKNSVASMIGTASLVKNYHSRMTVEDLLSNIDEILDEGYHHRSILDSLLRLFGIGKSTDVELTCLNMHEIVERSCTLLSDQIVSCGATINFPDEWPRAIGYAPWVEQVWTNYISNALKYGGQPPIVTLGAEVLGDPDDSVQRVRFSVADNGQGLTTEQQNVLFQPLTRFTNLRVIEGHGLGLSIVQRIIDRLGGEVDVVSTPGQGSCFSFTLQGA